MISILLATYNGVKYIVEQLDSLAAQTMQDFICYIHDDGSTDGTVEVVRRWIDDKGRQSQFVILEGPVQGSARDNFLWMLSQVESEYYMFCDQDDVWLDKKIEITYSRLKEIEKEDTPTCVFCDMKVVGDSLNPISDSFIRYMFRDPMDVRYQRLLIENIAAGCTMIINKSLRDIAILSVERALIEMHDRYIIVLAAVCGIVECIDTPLVLYRQHDNNEMGAKTETQLGRLVRNIKEAVSGDLFNKKRIDRDHGKNLARAVLSCGAYIEEPTRGILTKFADIDNVGKIGRMRFYRKYGFNRFHNNLWYLLWV